MSGTQDLTALAADPPAFDTELDGLHKQAEALEARIAAAQAAAHREAGDKQRYEGRKRVWSLPLHDALARAPKASAARDLLTAELAPVADAIGAMNEVYSRAPWPRFFPSVTKSQPHIHATLRCRTLHADTQMSWEPALSGKTEAEAVAKLDEALCSVCFPSAPVALHNHASKRGQAERDDRAAAKAARDAAQDAKTLTAEETFRTAGYHGGDWVTTVSGCKTLLRAPIETAAKLAWWQSAKAPAQDPEAAARRVAGITERLAYETADAARAEALLLSREERRPGSGATAEEIAKTRANAERRAAKEW